MLCVSGPRYSSAVESLSCSQLARSRLSNSLQPQLLGLLLLCLLACAEVGRGWDGMLSYKLNACYTIRCAMRLRCRSGAARLEYDPPEQIPTPHSRRPHHVAQHHERVEGDSTESRQGEKKETCRERWKCVRVQCCVERQTHEKKKRLFVRSSYRMTREEEGSGCVCAEGTDDRPFVVVVLFSGGWERLSVVCVCRVEAICVGEFAVMCGPAGRARCLAELGWAGFLEQTRRHCSEDAAVEEEEEEVGEGPRQLAELALLAQSWLHASLPLSSVARSCLRSCWRSSCCCRCRPR